MERKFDFRVFLAILSIDPLMVMAHDMIVKISGEKFDRNAKELDSMTTNTSLKGEDVAMEELKWTPEELETHLINEGKV